MILLHSKTTTKESDNLRTEENPQFPGGYMDIINDKSQGMG